MNKKNIITIGVILLGFGLLIGFIFKTVIPAVQKYNDGQKVINQIMLLDEEKKTIQSESSRVSVEYDRCSAYQQDAIVLLSGNKAKISDIENKQDQLRLKYNRVMGSF